MNTIYLDMDQVICDFNSRVIELIGKPLSEFPTSQDGWDALGDHKFDMYSKLKPMPDAKELVYGAMVIAREHGYILAVLTAVPKYGRVPLAKAHKVEWLENYFPHLLQDFNIGPWAEDKYKHCRQGDILIDDSTMNIPQWNAAGGIGILHTSAKSSLNLLSTYVEGLHASA